MIFLAYVHQGHDQEVSKKVPLLVVGVSRTPLEFADTWSARKLSAGTMTSPSAIRPFISEF